MRLCLVLVMLAISGCIEWTNSGSDASLGVTAKQAYPAALDEVRRAWKPQARLSVVESLERTNESFDFSTAPEFMGVLSAETDPNPGDGRARRWLFAFVDDQRDPDQENPGPAEYYVIVDGTGDIVLSRPMRDSEGTVVPFTWHQSWELDSDEASTKAAEASKIWQSSSPAPSFTWLMLAFLPRGEDRPGDLAWRFSVSFDGEESEWINVNAQTGETWLEEPPPEI